MNVTTRENVAHVWNVLDGRQTAHYSARPGATLRELAPVGARTPVLCCVDGVYYDEADWHLVEPLPHEAVVFQVIPLGGGGNGGSLMAVIGVVLIAFGAFTGNLALIGAGTGLLLGGVLQPPTATPLLPQAQQAESTNYNVQLQGNTARIGQAIPVMYGRHLLFPDFAAPPYQYFGEDDKQYYAALLSFGMMDSYRVEREMIANTAVSQFEGISLEYVGAGNAGGVPGVGTIASLSSVHPAVVSAPEVANQELSQTEYVGPFAVCGQSLEANRIEVDVVCPLGLYYAEDDGALTEKSVTVRFEKRLIHPISGRAIGSWSVLVEETITRTQNSPVRVTLGANLSAGRWQVRGSRVDAKDSNARAGHAVHWAGLRSFLTVEAPLEEAGNYVALVALGTNQLSGISQRKFGMIVQRWLPAWSPGTGWSAPAATDAIAWAAADVAKNTEYGLGLSDAEIDLATLYDLHQVWTARYDHFCGVFDQRITAWDALTIILRAGRARPIMRGNVLTFVRDQEQSIPSTFYTQHANIGKGSFNAVYNFVLPDDVDGVEVGYYSHLTWNTEFVRLPIPGSGMDVDDIVAPKQIILQGVDNEKQALRECAFYAACIAYRQTRVNWRTEMEGFLAPFGDVVGVVHDVFGTGYAGFIEAWDGATATTSENISFAAGDNYVVLRGEENDLYGPYRVAPGEGPRTFTFIDAPAITPYVGTGQERTSYALGYGTEWAARVKLTQVAPSASGLAQLSGFVDDPRVYTADTPYLGYGGGGVYGYAGDPGSGGGGSIPGGGIPGSRTAVYMPDESPTYTAASDEQRATAGFYAGDDYTVNGDAPYTYG